MELYVPWMLWLAEISPRIVVSDLETTSVGSGVVRVTGVVENEGYLPTYITNRALENETAVPVRVTLELTDAELVTGLPRTTLGHLMGYRNGQGSTGNSSTRAGFEYVIRATGGNARVVITVRSEKGGVVRRAIELR